MNEPQVVPHYEKTVIGRVISKTAANSEKVESLPQSTHRKLVDYFERKHFETLAHMLNAQDPRLALELRTVANVYSLLANDFAEFLAARKVAEATPKES